MNSNADKIAFVVDYIENHNVNKIVVYVMLN